MRSRILTIALAFSLFAAVFCAIPTNAAVDYTGSVKTTDSTGAAKELFFLGEHVYVDVELNYQGTPYDGNIRVELQRTTDGWVYDWFNERTNDPVVGWYNSSQDNTWLDTWAGIPGDMMTYDVVVYYTGTWDEIARKTIVVKDTGLWLDPPDDPYYPGEQVTITLITTYTTDVFYVQIVNETGATMKNWSGQVALEGWWQTVWTVASDFPDGDFTLNVRDQGSHAIWNQESFAVQKYTLMIDRDRSNFLPGETARITYAVFEIATLAPYTGASLTFSANWLNSSGNMTWQNGTLAGSEGTQSFIIPSDIALYSDVEITYWANETAGTRTAEETIWLYIDTLSADIDVAYGPYMPGDTVLMDVAAWVGWSDLPDAEVDIAVERNGTVVSAYSVDDLMTDLNGDAQHSFKLVADAAQGTYIVNASISKMGYSVIRMSVFEVDWAGDLIANLDKAYYYGGDTVTASFRTIWNNQDMADASVAYIAWIDSGVLTTGTTTSGSASFDLPASYFGWVWVDAMANIDGYMLGDSVGAEVKLADLVLTAASDQYAAGDEVSFLFEISTSLTTATLEYEIIDDEGVTVATGNPAFEMSGSFEFTVPADPSESYTATLTLRSGTGGIVTASDTVDLYDLYDLSIWAGASSYTSGMFKPGDTVDIRYTINTYGQADLPVYKIVISMSWSDDQYMLLVTESEGSVEIVVPDSAPNGWFYVDATLYNGIGGGWLSSDSTMFMVNENLSSWDKSVGGMSSVDLLIVILLIIMIVMLIVVPLVMSKMGKPKKTPAKSEPAPPEPPK